MQLVEGMMKVLTVDLPAADHPRKHTQDGANDGAKVDTLATQFLPANGKPDGNNGGTQDDASILPVVSGSR